MSATKYEYDRIPYLLAAHISRAGTMTEWMDPAVLDENDPTKRDPELDIYDSNNPNQPPYSSEFIEKYRAAQIARNRRITQWVKDKLDAFRNDGLYTEEFAFVVHGSMADRALWTPPSTRTNASRNDVI